MTTTPITKRCSHTILFFVAPEWYISRTMRLRSLSPVIRYCNPQWGEACSRPQTSGGRPGGRPDGGGVSQKAAVSSRRDHDRSGERNSYCNRAYYTLTVADATETVKAFGQERNKLGVLWFNTAHNLEHYGNLVVDMRLKGLAPLSSDR